MTVSPLVVGAALGASAATVGYYALRRRGCTNGHVYGDWEATNRLRTIPHPSKSVVLVEREHERACKREGCSHTETEYQRQQMANDDALDALEHDVYEARHRCPSCLKVSRDSEQSVSYRQESYGTWKSEAKCPHCRQKNDWAHWEFVDHDPREVYEA